MQNEHEKFVRQAIGFTNEHGEPKPVIPEYIVKAVEMVETLIEKARCQPTNLMRNEVNMIVANAIMQHGGAIPVKPKWDPEADERKRREAQEAAMKKAEAERKQKQGQGQKVAGGF